MLGERGDRSKGELSKRISGADNGARRLRADVTDTLKLARERLQGARLTGSRIEDVRVQPRDDRARRCRILLGKLRSRVKRQRVSIAESPHVL